MVLEGLLDRLQEVGMLKVALLAIVVAAQLYFVYITTPIQNFNPETNTILYGTEDEVPQHPVTWFHALVSIAAVVALFVHMNAKDDRYEIIDHNTALAIVRKDLDRLTKETNYQDSRFRSAAFSVTDFTLKRMQMGEQMMPNRYVVISKIVPTSELEVKPFYYRHEVNPFTGRIERRFESGGALRASMLCSNCNIGNTADFRIVYAKDLQIARDLRKDILDYGKQDTK